MYPRVTQFETNDALARDRARLDVERRAALRPRGAAVRRAPAGRIRALVASLLRTGRPVGA